MKNIIRIARNDIHNIRKNVIALIVIFGITIVPSLYAWFNIAASWDPYKNTGNLKVAVASLDKGYDGELLPVRLNLGNDIISSLRENTQLHWIFTDAKDASNGVRSGKYYASVVISETFSKDMMSLFSSETTHPTITYCINEKENAIAPKVTEKGADAIRQEINETFTETISKTALDAFRFVADVSAEKGDASLAENLSASLAEISADLDSASGTVQAFSDMTDAASLMLDTTSVIFSHTGDGTKTSLG
ncbi:YhgE/Pip domain-containing protein, partial [[Ruminococcus] torques]